MQEHFVLQHKMVQPLRHVLHQHEVEQEGGYVAPIVFCPNDDEANNKASDETSDETSDKAQSGTRLVFVGAARKRSKAHVLITVLQYVLWLTSVS